MPMDKEQKRYYTRIAEKIFAMPPGERRQYLSEIKKRDGEFYERIEHLTHFLKSRENVLNTYAQSRIREILSDLDITS